MQKNLELRRNISIGILFAFLGHGLTIPPAYAHAQDFYLPAPGVMVHLSPEFNPPILKGIKIHPDNPFRFDFILDKGDSQLSKDALKDESSKLIKYFLASLTIPEKDLWVNLSPYEKNRIVPESFGQTEMGRDLLAEDYMLKQITASLIYPEGEIGKKFWKRIYEETAKKFGTTNIPMNTFNKVWIVPEKAVVYENTKAGTAYVVESKLKILLEQDYLALKKNSKYSSSVMGGGISTLGSQIVREIVIPELTKEVNEDKNFSQLRQVYNSLILATWYKKKIKDSILEQVYADKNKITGVNIDDPQEKQKIYERYLQAFKKGVYNYIKEEQDPVTQQTIPRKYFSGGVDFAMSGDGSTTMKGIDGAMTVKDSISALRNVHNSLRPSRLIELGVNVISTNARLNREAATKKIVQQFNTINGPKVVDIGSGHGDFLKNYLMKYPGTAGLGYENDPFAVLFGMAANRIWQVFGDARQTGLLSESIDKVFINMPAPAYVRSNEKGSVIAGYLKEARRILKPGGEVYIVFQANYPELDPVILKDLQEEGFKIEQNGKPLFEVEPNYPPSRFIMRFIDMGINVNLFKARKDQAMKAADRAMKSATVTVFPSFQSLDRLPILEYIKKLTEAVVFLEGYIPSKIDSSKRGATLSYQVELSQLRENPFIWAIVRESGNMLKLEKYGKDQYTLSFKIDDYFKLRASLGRLEFEDVFHKLNRLNIEIIAAYDHPPEMVRLYMDALRASRFYQGFARDVEEMLSKNLSKRISPSDLWFNMAVIPSKMGMLHRDPHEMNFFFGALWRKFDAFQISHRDDSNQGFIDQQHAHFALKFLSFLYFRSGINPGEQSLAGTGGDSAMAANATLVPQKPLDHAMLNPPIDEMLAEQQLILSEPDKAFLKTIHGLVAIGKNGKRYQFWYDQEHSSFLSAEFEIREIDAQGAVILGREQVGVLTISKWDKDGYIDSTGKARIVLNSIVMYDKDDRGEGIFNKFLSALPRGTGLKGSNVVNHQTLSDMISEILGQKSLSEILSNNKIQNIRKYIHRKDFESSRMIPCWDFLYAYQEAAHARSDLHLKNLIDVFNGSLLGRIMRQSGFHNYRVIFDKKKRMSFISAKTGDGARAIEKKAGGIDRILESIRKEDRAMAIDATVQRFNKMRDIFKIVDLGTGDGAFLDDLQRQYPGAAIIGIENNPDMIAQGIEKRVKGNIVVGDARHTGVLSNSVNKVTVNLPYPYGEPLLQILTEARRILYPGHELNVVSEMPEQNVLSVLGSLGFEILEHGPLSQIAPDYPRTRLMVKFGSRVRFFRARKLDRAMAGGNIIKDNDVAMTIMDQAGQDSKTDEFSQGLQMLGDHSIPVDERAGILVYLWKKYSPYGYENIPASLQRKIILYLGRNAYTLSPFLIAGKVSANFVRSLLFSVQLTRQEKDFLWPIFHEEYPEHSNRSKYLSGGRIDKMLLKRQEEGANKVSVLDVGCGPTGIALHKLKEVYKEKVDAFGIDIDIEAGQPNEDVKLYKGDVEDMHFFKSESFDIVNENFVSGYWLWLEDFVNAVNEIMRVLKKDGVFILMEWNENYNNKEILGIIFKELGYEVKIEKGGHLSPFYIYKKSYRDPGKSKLAVLLSIENKLNQYARDHDRPLLRFWQISESHVADVTMRAGKDQASELGGIDLTSDKALSVQNKGEGIKFHLDPAQLEELQNAPGFVPVIINIQPMTNIRLWLGLNAANDNFPKSANDNQPTAILKAG